MRVGSRHRFGAALGAALALSACDGDTGGAASDAAPAVVAPAAEVAPRPPVDCSAYGELNYVCGPANAEDIVRLGASDWLIVSGMTPLQGPPTPGKIYLVDRTTKVYEELFPGVAVKFETDYATFGECPGPIDTRR